MPTATVIPRYINPPKNPGWPANIKDGDGGYWSFKPQHVPMSEFTVGQEVTFDWLPETSKDGREFRVIKRVHNPHSIGQHPGPAPARQQKPANGVGFRPPVSEDERESMRVTSWGNAFIAAGKISPTREAIADLVAFLTEGVRSGRLRTASPQHNDTDIRDEIPY